MATTGFSAPTTYRVAKGAQGRVASARKAGPGVKGPRKVSVKAQKARNRRVLLSLVAGVVFVLGIMMGHASAMASPEAHQPPASVQAQLTWAQAHSTTPCHAVWTAAGWDVTCLKK